MFFFIERTTKNQNVLLTRSGWEAAGWFLIESKKIERCGLELGTYYFFPEGFRLLAFYNVFKQRDQFQFDIHNVYKYQTIEELITKHFAKLL